MLDGISLTITSTRVVAAAGSIGHWPIGQPSILLSAKADSPLEGTSVVFCTPRAIVNDTM
jgi:hypothetical protein